MIPSQTCRTHASHPTEGYSRHGEQPPTTDRSLSLFPRCLLSLYFRECFLSLSVCLVVETGAPGATRSCLCSLFLFFIVYRMLCRENQKQMSLRFLFRIGSTAVFRVSSACWSHNTPAAARTSTFGNRVAKGMFSSGELIDGPPTAVRDLVHFGAPVPHEKVRRRR